MLKVYLNELRKVKRQKTVRMIMLVGVLMPTFSFALCLHNGYRFRNLVGMNILLGNFLVAPFLFSIILVMLFSMEEQNDTLKTILVTAVPKSKILLSKIEVAFTFVLIFSIINCLYTFAGGIFLGMSSAFVLKALKALFITRGMDMIECTIRDKGNRPQFQMDHCIVALEASADVRANKKKIFTVTRRYAYE